MAWWKIVWPTVLLNHESVNAILCIWVNQRKNHDVCSSHEPFFMLIMCKQCEVERSMLTFQQTMCGCKDNIFIFQEHLLISPFLNPLTWLYHSTTVKENQLTDYWKCITICINENEKTQPHVNDVRWSPHFLWMFNPPANRQLVPPPSHHSNKKYWTWYVNQSTSHKKNSCSVNGLRDPS